MKLRYLVVLLCLPLLSACCEKGEPKYRASEIVRMRLDGREAMVIYAYHLGCKKDDGSRLYTVRVGDKRVFTDTHILEKDGPVYSVPYQELTVHEYELESISQVGK